MRTRLRAAIAATAAVAALAGGMVAGVGQADARVAPGKYTYTTYTNTLIGQQRSTTPAKVQGNVLTLYTGQGIRHYRITPTRYGGYADVAGVRMVFAKAKRGYAGTVYYWGIPNSHNTLKPR